MANEGPERGGWHTPEPSLLEQTLPEWRQAQAENLQITSALEDMIIFVEIECDQLRVKRNQDSAINTLMATNAANKKYPSFQRTSADQAQSIQNDIEHFDAFMGALEEAANKQREVILNKDVYENYQSARKIVAESMAAVTSNLISLDTSEEYAMYISLGHHKLILQALQESQNS